MVKEAKEKPEKKRETRNSYCLCGCGTVTGILTAQPGVKHSEKEWKDFQLAGYITGHEPPITRDEYEQKVLAGRAAMAALVLVSTQGEKAPSWAKKINTAYQQAMKKFDDGKVV